MRAARRAGYAAGAVVVLVAALSLAMGQQSLPLFVDHDAAAVVGVYHLHSEQSHDSDVTQHAYVQAAKQLGLDFIVLTEHNAQTEPLDASDDVCVLASAELSTSYGHVVGLGAPALLSDASRGNAHVLQHIEQQGATAVIAHPSDAKRPWIAPLPEHGGLEIANWSASVRRRAPELWPVGPLWAAAWFANRALALAQLYDRDDAALALWDAPKHAALAGFCAIDAHGWIAPRDNLTGWHVVLEGVARQSPMAQSRHAIMSALRGGHFYCAAGLLGRAPPFDFAARQQALPVGRNGDVVAQGKVDCLTAHAPRISQAKTRLVVLCDGAVISNSDAALWQLAHPAPGVYRVELWAELPQMWGSARAVPVLYSNKITVTA